MILRILMLIGIRRAPIILCDLTEKLNVPAKAGVPEINPVFAFKIRPGGRPPDKIIGGTTLGT